MRLSPLQLLSPPRRPGRTGASSDRDVGETCGLCYNLCAMRPGLTYVCIRNAGSTCVVRRSSGTAAETAICRIYRTTEIRSEGNTVPALFGNQALPQDTLKADRKSSLRIGPLGMGKRALYLNSFFFSRRYYVLWSEVKRVYKLVAMSKGGFTGIGAFGAMSYLVVELRDGRSKRCQIKYEMYVDEALDWIAKNHPEIPNRSETAQKKLDEAEAQAHARLKKDLSGTAIENIRILEEAEQYLEKEPLLYRVLQNTAGKKRVQQTISPGRRALGITIFAGSILALAAGIPLMMQRHPAGIYMVMLGAAFFLFSSVGNLVPVGRNSPKRIRKEWESAVSDCEAYIGKRDSFPVPGRYAHPVVLRRMARVIREGRAEEIPQALEVVKADLKALNKSVTVSQQEYDEVVAVKAMFLVSDYQ